MESQPPDRTAPRTGDAESKMRQNLGLNGSPSSSSSDPLKAARQAIRSQVTAREFTERQLVQAQNAIQDLRSRLRHVHQEREAAINAAQSAMVAKDAAERSVRAAESALANERAARGRIEGMLRDAQATILDLREKLATANQTIKSTQAELSAERLARSSVDDGAVVAPKVVTPIDREAVPAVRRPVGRPRKVAVVAATVQTVITASDKPLAIPADAMPPNMDAATPVVRRPVGRPRKIVAGEPTSTLLTPPKNLRASAKADKPKQKISNPGADDEEPVQWWIEGWKGR